MQNKYAGPERRKFIRLDYIKPLAYKICKKETIKQLLKGYTSDLSQTGILCNIKYKVEKDDILWLSFDRATLNICTDIEKNSLIYQGGVIGKVVRVEHKSDGSYNVGMRFITREESGFPHIYPKIHCLDDNYELHTEET